MHTIEDVGPLLVAKLADKYLTVQATKHYHGECRLAGGNKILKAHPIIT